MKQIYTPRFWLVGFLLGGILAAVSCEDAETRSAIEVTPDHADLYGNGATAVFTAEAVFNPDTTNRNEELVYPLEWSVSNPSLGGIMKSAGNSAVYESNGTRGQNVVIVRDQFGREGLAGVSQRSHAPTGTMPGL